jgi:tRNA nucleotidyltransferase (CCA-adding enzyme)
LWVRVLPGAHFKRLSATMLNKTKFEIPKEVREVSLVLSAAGYENFLVGGCVRDIILGRTPKDWDIATIATPEEIIALFPKTFYENEFGTVGVVNEETEEKTLKVIEITPYRIETGYSDFRRPDEVKWGSKIEEDLARRDFTINALAYDVEKSNLLDPYNGLLDIKKKLIRTVGKPEDRFGEDALRMLRALRLSAELGFAIEHDTQEAITKQSQLLAHISKERIRDEFERIIMSDSPAVALELSARLGLLQFIAPELLKSIGVEQNQAHAYKVWEHLMRSLDHAVKKNFPLYVRLAALFHDVAKPHTREWKNNQWTFYGHEVVGARITRQTLTDLKFPKEIVDKVTKLVRWHMFFSDTEEISLSAVRRMVRNVTPELIWDLIDVRTADRIGTGRPKETPYRLRKYKSMIEQVMRDPISVKQLAIDGKEIMEITKKGAGPHIGFILEILLSEVLEKPELNTKEYLEKRVTDLSSLSPEELSKQGREARKKNESEEEQESEKIKEKYKVN